MSMTKKCGPSPSLFISRANTVGKNFASVLYTRSKENYRVQSTDNPMLGSENFNNIGINLMPRFATELIIIYCLINCTEF